MMTVPARPAHYSGYFKCRGTIIYGVLQKRPFLKHSSTGFLIAFIDLILGTYIFVYVLVYILTGIYEIRAFALQGHKIHNLHHPSKPKK